MTTLGLLQDWYRSKCDGQWEHTYGIRISTLDNPGWKVEIDLNDTELASKEFGQVALSQDTELEWYLCRVQDGKFQAFCGPVQLTEVIDIFIRWSMP